MKSKKLWFLTTCLSSLLFQSDLFSATTGYVTGKYMNVRGKPTTNSQILGKVDRNDEFTVIKNSEATSDERTWHYVRFNKDNLEGWVASWLVKIHEETPGEVAATPHQSVPTIPHNSVTPENPPSGAKSTSESKTVSNSGIQKPEKPNKSAEEYFNEGIDFLVKGLYDKALEVNKKAFELKPDDIQIMNNLANSYYRVGKVDDAVEIWKKSMGFEENTDVANNLGIVFFNQEKYTDAKFYYEKAIQIDEKNSEAYFNLASLHGIMRNYEKAVENFKKFKEMSGDKELTSEAEKRIAFCQKQLTSSYTASTKK